MDLESMIHSKYYYLKSEEVILLLNHAKAIAIDQLYPADLSVNYLNFDWTNARFDMWLLACVDELVEREGIGSVVLYRENGVSKDFGRTGVRQELLSRLPRNLNLVT